jgi:opacity protein-like surface antigen
MKKLLIGAALCALFAAPAFAGDPVQLSSSQMDQVTAGSYGYGGYRHKSCCQQSNYNNTYQKAVAIANSYAYWGGATAVATNVNSTDQSNR